jgi:hypothetical protein
MEKHDLAERAHTHPAMLTVIFHKLGVRHDDFT